MLDVSLAAACLAGLLSFLSPCVLPLVPPYLSYMAGVSVEHLRSEGQALARRRALLAALLFVLGFSTVFIALGATASLLGQLLRSQLIWLGQASGVIIILMGLHFLGVFRLSWFYREARFQTGRPLGLWSAYLIGLAFAFGWTPCIGPVLATILAVAGTETSAARGALLLSAYSLGLGVPFLLAAGAMQSFAAMSGWLRSHMIKVEKVMGSFLVLTGIAFLTGSLGQASFWLLETFPSLARLG